ncbi:hypothetical protein GCM10011402_28380 [Paracoccus acridae]|uniref:Uncharacterized protein n=1 Tax=Paracoccus acridae TaxID=1795310 RepID=A0ABQ1VLP7_9RHOB|nr:hypothetical protein GCM10011402_28380 [Paracoccus acridae]
MLQLLSDMLRFRRCVDEGEGTAKGFAGLVYAPKLPQKGATNTMIIEIAF